MKGKFIVIEGLEGAGKTTAQAIICQILQQQGIRRIIHTREPGGTPLAERLRDLIKNGLDDEPITEQAEILMLYAARAQLVENVIKPALAEGTWVIGDRHDLSSQAYQGGGRGLDRDFLLRLKREVLGDFRPDLTLYLDVEPHTGLQRARGRGALDRIEQQSILFFERTRRRYLELLDSDPTIKRVNANVSPLQVEQQITTLLHTWLAEST